MVILVKFVTVTKLALPKKIKKRKSDGTKKGECKATICILRATTQTEHPSEVGFVVCDLRHDHTTR